VKLCIYRNSATDYDLSVEAAGIPARGASSPDKTEMLTASLQVLSQPPELRLLPASEEASPQASGGEHLSSGEVSSLPLNARDFSKLLLLAAGTMTDANGAANFTQQFAVNGQRGSATVFARRRHHDPEMEGPPSPTSTWTRSVSLFGEDTAGRTRCGQSPITWSPNPAQSDSQQL
jgi:hypothetical protein